MNRAPNLNIFENLYNSEWNTKKLINHNMPNNTIKLAQEEA